MIVQSVVQLARWSIWSSGFSPEGMIQSKIDVIVNAPNLIYRLTFLNTAQVLIYSIPHLQLAKCLHQQMSGSQIIAQECLAVCHDLNAYRCVLVIKHVKTFELHDISILELDVVF